MENRYDAIIIGSGCGGAASAALMSHLGMKTLLLEKNDILGGRTATFERDGFKIDHGHIIMRCEKGPHGEVLRLVKRKDLIPKYTHCMNWTAKAIVADIALDFNPSFWATVFNFQIFGIFAQYQMTPWEIIQFCRFGAYCLLMPRNMISKLDEIDMKSYLSRFFTNKYLHNFFGGLATVGFGALSDESSAGEMVRVLQKGIYDITNMGYPVNGEGVSAIPKSFLRAAKAKGCEIQTNVPVESIIIENGKVQGVRVNGNTISAPIVISNIGIQETMTWLVGEEHFEPEYIKRIKNLKYSYGGMSLKFATDRKITDYAWGGDIPDNLDQITNDMMMGKIPEKFPMMFVCASNIDPSLAPKNKQVLSFISGGPAAPPDEIDWGPWAEKMKAQCEALVPGLKDHTLFWEASTPDEIALFTGRIHGDAVGVSQTVDQVGKLRPSPISPIPGLYYTGSDVGRDNFATELASESAIRLYKHFKKELKKNKNALNLT